MRTEPCPYCTTELLRDDSPGVLVCGVCRKLVEFPADPEGGLNPKVGDRRWFGNEDERADVAELGLPEPTLPETEYERLRRRVEQQQVELAVGHERSTLSEVELDRSLADFEHRRRRH